MTIKEQLIKILRSRKFWVLCASLLGIVAAAVAQQVTVWQALQAALAAMCVYSTGVALEGPLK